MSLVSLALLGAYFAGGMQFMMANEGWDAADAFYFWCCPCTVRIVVAWHEFPDLMARFHSVELRLLCRTERTTVSS